MVDVVVLGAGAAGLFAAITAAQRGRKVVVVDHADAPGKKILISGGGRCNFTNMWAAPENFLSANPHFCKSALSRYTQWDFIAMVDKHCIAYHEKTLGQLFCDVSSKQIVQMLVDECATAGVRIETGCAVKTVRRSDAGFEVVTAAGSFRSQSVVVATGGLSLPKMGATGLGYELAQQFGIDVLPTRAGLVPFTLSGKPLDELAGLSGVALPVAAAAKEGNFREAMLFTHRGLSGPAVLQISSYWQPGEVAEFNLLPDEAVFEWLCGCRDTQPNAQLKTVLASKLPKRVAERFCELWFGSRVLQSYSNEELSSIADTLSRWSIKPSGTEGYRTAEVTLGGVNTDELSSKTMESKQVPGLYFVGEVVDVTGHLGGYNFQWAWSSGYAAGSAA